MDPVQDLDPQPETEPELLINRYGSTTLLPRTGNVRNVFELNFKLVEIL
jgi:hypothetical protein